MTSITEFSYTYWPFLFLSGRIPVVIAI